MSSLLVARTAYLSALSTDASLEGVQVYSHGGEFDLAQLKAYSRQAPCVVLALLKFSPTIQAGIVTCTAKWGLVAITKNDAAATRRAESVIELTEKAVKVLLRVFAGEAAAQRPKDMQAVNLFSAALDQVSIAMWGVEFTQYLDLVETFDSDDLTSVHLIWDLYPRDNDADLGTVLEAEDDVELPT